MSLYSSDQLDILRSCVKNNPVLGLTGLLYFDRIFFLQVLEGELMTINTMCERLRQDRRHSNMRVIRLQKIPARRFETWGMVFSDGTSTQNSFSFNPSKSLLEKAETGDAKELLDDIERAIVSS